MQRNIDQLKRQRFDLLVIGGGINGAAIAHLAARRGLSVALLEKGDFACGTSSKSTKLIHGGIRYLENLEFDLVYESLKERQIQLRAAPHLVQPLGFVIPVYRNDRRPLWMIRFGVFLYDLIAGPYKIRNHQPLTATQILELEPGIKKDGLLGGVLYYDAQMDDARLCLENVLSACRHGAQAANYVKVVSLIKDCGTVTGVKAHDELNNEDFEVSARNVVCTVGPWTNSFLRLDDPQAKKKVRTTKGIHIVYEGQLSRHAFLITSKSDKRIFFVIPWMGHSLIGTTDTDYIKSPDHVAPSGEDIDYLFREAERVFPGIAFNQNKILNVFAGLRPLVRRGGSVNKVSRKHLFYKSPSGMIFVVGGKYTTYRKIAEECVNCIKKASDGEPFELYGSGSIQEASAQVGEKYGLSADIIEMLMNKYGTRYRDVLKLTDENPGLKEKISEHPAVIMAQLVYAVRVEMARTGEDILERRLSLQYHGPISKRCREAAEQVLRNQ